MESEFTTAKTRSSDNFTEVYLLKANCLFRQGKIRESLAKMYEMLDKSESPRVRTQLFQTL